jgi:hypothetical protein
MVDVNNPIDQKEHDNAVSFLRKKLSPRDLGTIKYKMKTNPDWFKQQQYGVGLHVRNLLREGGFGWGDSLLYQEWKSLIDDVVHYGNR